MSWQLWYGTYSAQEKKYLIEGRVDFAIPMSYKLNCFQVCRSSQKIFRLLSSLNRSMELIWNNKDMIGEFHIQHNSSQHRDVETYTGTSSALLPAHGPNSMLQSPFCSSAVQHCCFTCSQHLVHLSQGYPQLVRPTHYPA